MSDLQNQGNNSNGNHAVCSDCWQVFLNPHELESHQNSCPQRLTLNTHSKTEENEKQNEEQDINKTDQHDPSNLPDQTDTTQLTVLKAMPPSCNPEVLTSQNGEILAMFGQSDENVGNLDNFTITLPASTILSSYIQQQSDQNEQMLTEQLKDSSQSDEQQMDQQQLYTESSQSPQQTLLTHCLLENGVINALPVSVIQKTNTSTTKSSSKRKLLPKPSGSVDQFSQIFQCTRCDFVFYNDASYRDHARSHAKVKEFACEYCGITLTKYEQMAKHLDKEHNSDLSYYCYLCYTPAEDKFSLQEHLKYCGKNTEANKNNHQSSNTSVGPTPTNQLLPNLLSGSTLKFGVDAKNVITCPKCGQILGTEEALNVSDKPVDHQCKYCSTNLTLMRQTGVSSLSDNKLLDLFNQTTSEENLNASVDTSLTSMPNTTSSNVSTSAPLLLYSQNPTTTFPSGSASPSLVSSVQDTSSANLSTMAVGNQNHMTVGINTSNGLMVLTLPVVTTDKVPSDSSVSAPVLQIPTGNILLLGPEVGAPLNMNTTGALQSNLSPNVACTASQPILPSSDILMTAAAGINAPTSESPGVVPLSLSTLIDDTTHDLKSKAPRYTCSHCGKNFELYQSWKRHEQKHTAPKKQHLCNVCGKSFSRPRQLKDHVNKIHGNTGDHSEANNNDVAMIKIQT